jgi:hypothetical protein
MVFSVDVLDEADTKCQGIAEQRKLDLAAKRIGKVIKLTKENDAMRAGAF